MYITVIFMGMVISIIKLMERAPIIAEKRSRQPPQAQFTLWWLPGPCADWPVACDVTDWRAVIGQTPLPRPGFSHIDFHRYCDTDTSVLRSTVNYSETR